MCGNLGLQVWTMNLNWLHRNIYEQSTNCLPSCDLGKGRGGLLGSWKLSRSWWNCGLVSPRSRSTNAEERVHHEVYNTTTHKAVGHARVNAHPKCFTFQIFTSKPSIRRPWEAVQLPSEATLRQLKRQLLASLEEAADAHLPRGLESRLPFRAHIQKKTIKA